MVHADMTEDPLQLTMHGPHPDLRPYVQRYWSIYSGSELASPVTRKIIADGGIGIVLNFGAPLALKTGKEFADNLSGPFVTGPTMHAAHLTAQGNANAMGIRFHPGGAYPFITGEMSDYRNKASALQSPDEPDWSSLFASLSMEAIPKACIDRIDSFLLGRLVQSRIALSDWLLDVSRIMWRHSGSLRIDDLCMEANISRRQLERRFKRALGLLPKQFSQIIRIDKSRAMIRSFSYSSLTEISHECKYHDQSHFITEFKKIVETTPKTYLREKQCRISTIHNKP